MRLGGQKGLSRHLHLGQCAGLRRTWAGQRPPPAPQDSPPQPPPRHRPALRLRPTAARAAFWVLQSSNSVPLPGGAVWKLHLPAYRTARPPPPPRRVVAPARRSPAAPGVAGQPGAAAAPCATARHGAPDGGAALPVGAAALRAGRGGDAPHRDSEGAGRGGKGGGALSSP